VNGADQIEGRVKRGREEWESGVGSRGELFESTIAVAAAVARIKHPPLVEDRTTAMWHWSRPPSNVAA
jgi:hypothetical protein